LPIRPRPSTSAVNDDAVTAYKRTRGPQLACAVVSCRETLLAGAAHGIWALLSAFPGAEVSIAEAPVRRTLGTGKQQPVAEADNGVSQCVVEAKLAEEGTGKGSLVVWRVRPGTR